MVDDATARFIRSKEFQGEAWGEPDWRLLNGTWRGRIDVAGTLELNVQLKVQYRPRRPDEPTVVLLAKGIGVWRIDHNGVHRGELSTHLQRHGGDDFQVLDPAELGSPQLGGGLGLSYLQTTMRSSARYLNIGTKGVDWTDPPGGE